MECVFFVHNETDKERCGAELYHHRDKKKCSGKRTQTKNCLSGQRLAQMITQCHTFDEKSGFFVETSLERNIDPLTIFRPKFYQKLFFSAAQGRHRWKTPAHTDLALVTFLSCFSSINNGKVTRREVERKV